MGRGKRTFITWSPVNNQPDTKDTYPRSYSLDKNLIKNTRGFFVYEWKRENDYLYIGCTENLFHRLSVHNIINRIEPLQEIDEILIYICDSMEEMFDLELREIKKFKPKYNKRNNKPPKYKITYA